MIQKAEVKDLPIVAELACKLWPDNAVEGLRSEMGEILAKPDAAFYIAYVEDVPAGFAQCQLRYDYVEGTDSSPVGYLEGIYVAEEYVDFNQGIDSRLITDENMAKLAEIPIRPVRIAFDHWSLRKKYEEAVRIAVKHGHTNLSNYILYNFEDRPLELYWRLKLNVDLCEELNASIYSFPMKYHPIEDPDYFSNRDYIGKHWNRKFIRTIQAILNSTKGKVGKGHDFFCKAFGANEEEFYKLLYMPEAMIIYRFYFEGIGMTEKWWNDFNSLNEEEMRIIKPIIEHNDFSDIGNQTDNANVLRVLQYYCITREDAERAMADN